MSSAKAAGVFCVLFLAVVSSGPYHARASEDAATIDKLEVVKHCWKNIQRAVFHPYPAHSGECCDVIRASKDVPAICGKFTAEELAKINLVKWAALARFCGNGVPAGTDCAGYVVPHVPPVRLMDGEVNKELVCDMAHRIMASA